MQAALFSHFFVFPFADPVVSGWIGISGLLLGVLGISLAIYYGRRAEKRRIPTFVIQPSPEVLIKEALLAYRGFSVKFHNIPVIEQSVVAVHIQFWNRGSLPIIKSEILRPYKIVFPKSCKFLDLAIVKQSRPEIQTKLCVDNGDEQEFVSIDFNILEPGDGMTIHVLYNGPATAKFEFDGVCIGAPGPEVIDSAYVRYKHPLHISKPTRISLGCYLVLLVVIFVYDHLIVPSHPLLARVGEVIGYVFLGLLGLILVAAISGFGYFQFFKTKRVPSAIVKP